MTKNFQNALWTHIGEQNHLVLGKKVQFPGAGKLVYRPEQ